MVPTDNGTLHTFARFRPCPMVLVVDDNVGAAVTLAMILGVDGHATQVAHSGPEAIRLVESFRPALVFLDIGMPGMNGCEAAEAIRRTIGGGRLRPPSHQAGRTGDGTGPAGGTR
jgi:CheY-like chemotaxis protein